MEVGVLWGGRGRPAFGTRTTTTIREEIRQTVETGVESRTGTSLAITEQFDQTSVGDRVVSRDPHSIHEI